MVLNAIGRLGAGVAATLILSSTGAMADAIQVRASTPTSGAVLTGPHAEYVIRFDRPVDHASSRIYVMQSGHLVQSLVPRGDSAPEVLFAGGEMPSAGEYQLHWEARSPGDSVVSSGIIPFSVSRQKVNSP